MKIKMVSVRMPMDDYKKLHERAVEMGIPTASYIRYKLFKDEVRKDDKQ